MKPTPNNTDQGTVPIMKNTAYNELLAISGNGVPNSKMNTNANTLPITAAIIIDHASVHSRIDISVARTQSHNVLRRKLLKLYRFTKRNQLEFREMVII